MKTIDPASYLAKMQHGETAPPSILTTLGGTALALNCDITSGDSANVAQSAIRAATIAAGLFHKPLMDELPQAVQQSLVARNLLPKWFGKSAEFAALAATIVENVALNAEVMRLDGALANSPR